VGRTDESHRQFADEDPLTLRFNAEIDPSTFAGQLDDASTREMILRAGRSNGPK